jgi:hypothetical protein
MNNILRIFVQASKPGEDFARYRHFLPRGFSHLPMICISVIVEINPDSQSGLTVVLRVSLRRCRSPEIPQSNPRVSVVDDGNQLRSGL